MQIRQPYFMTGQRRQDDGPRPMRAPEQRDEQRRRNESVMAKPDAERADVPPAGHEPEVTCSRTWRQCPLLFSCSFSLLVLGCANENHQPKRKPQTKTKTKTVLLLVLGR
jgi:hypothetical protein